MVSPVNVINDFKKYVIKEQIKSISKVFKAINKMMKESK